jgi:hypothetical protein
MYLRTPLTRFVLTAALVAVPCVAAGSAPAAASSNGDCATVALTARPSLNTAMIPETLTSTVTSCATATETVVLVQHLSAPMERVARVSNKTYRITLAPSQSVKKVRHVPYVCCGTYTVTDTVSTTTGTQLSKAKATFTFA